MSRAIPQQRPDLVEAGLEHLSLIERLQIAAIRKSFEPGVTDRALRWCQRNLGQQWIYHSTKHLCETYGLERLPELDPAQSYLCASNHRSFFDMYVITTHLVRRGMPHRLVFPVRSRFFYDSALGFAVNGLMSFFSMYPPIFRERKRAFLNQLSLDELTYLLDRGGCFTGVHPEGTRNQGADPYTFLPAQRGIGRMAHATQAVVLPVFINGLLNDLPQQVWSNFNGKGQKVNVVFGAPVPLDDLRAQPASKSVDKAIAERVMEHIAQLAREEHQLRFGAPLAPAARVEAPVGAQAAE